MVDAPMSVLTVHLSDGQNPILSSYSTHLLQFLQKFCIFFEKR